VDAWAQGLPARAPSPVSSFAAVDAVLARLADRRRFPDLRVVVLAGHSAGGQFVQRYAVVGQGEAVLRASGIHLRYVVANPSTYLVVGAMRRAGDDTSCRGVGRWKYGLEDAPAYVARPLDADTLLKDYLRRDVVYLLGTADTDPQGDGLDRSCAAEAQGPTRFARGLAFVARLEELFPGTPQQLRQVPGVGHHSAAMFTSAPGLRALFGDVADDDRGAPAQRPSRTRITP
jgi:pimeloyl-ACP methyl ester carboxylesterase